MGVSIVCVVLDQVHVEREQMPCHLTRTTAETHALIRANLAETPVYGGWVDSKGPRYCPSIEDKIVRFADKESHQVRGPVSALSSSLLSALHLYLRTICCCNSSWSASVKWQCEFIGSILNLWENVVTESKLLQVWVTAFSGQPCLCFGPMSFCKLSRGYC